MKVIFLSAMYSDIETEIALSKKRNSVSGHKFQENLARGLYENGCDMTIINVSRVCTYPNYPKIRIRRQKKTWFGGVSGTEIGFLNLSAIRYLTAWPGVYRAMRKEIKKHKNEPCVLVTFNSNLHFGLPMLLARLFHKNVMLCNVVGDLHGVYGLQNRTAGLKGRMIRLAEKIQDPMGRKMDAFVFFTEHMAKAMGVENKPNCVVEGMHPIQPQTAMPPAEGDGKIVFYAGAMCEEYGVEHLLRAFSMIEDEDYQLWLAGDGDTTPLVEECAAKDPRIQYLGYITPQQVEERQQSATVLVSPRTSEREFVKYSFASKTLESLASGKPYIAHRLPCDPPEYADHIQYPADESDEALRRKIVEICSLPAWWRQEIGEKARSFVANEKSPKTMCKRILAMWENVLQKEVTR